MVQGPVNYMVDMPNAFVEGLKGYQLSQNVMAQNQQMQAQQAMQQRRDQMSSDMAAFTNRQGKTREDYQRMMEMYPELKDQMTAAISNMNEEQKNAKVNQMMPIYAALKAGNTDAARESMKNLEDAYRSSGMDLEANNLKMLQDNLDIDPKGALASTEIFLFNADPEKFSKWSEAQTKLGAEARAQQLQPGEIKKQEASLVKMGIDNGLTQQQALKTAAETRKLDAETRKIIMDMAGQAQGGMLPPEKRFDYERKLAQEYQNNTKNFTQVQEAYRRIKAAENNAAGDLSLIFSYMKMLDPGSVVREGEFATAQNAAGVPERIVNIYNRLLSGERLGEKQRTEFRGQSEKLMTAAGKQEQNVRAGLEKVVKNYGLNSENVFTTPGAEAEQAAPPPGQGERTITKTGIDKATGRKVVQYSDGTIEYAQ